MTLKSILFSALILGASSPERIEIEDRLISLQYRFSVNTNAFGTVCIDAPPAPMHGFVATLGSVPCSVGDLREVPSIRFWAEYNLEEASSAAGLGGGMCQERPEPTEVLLVSLKSWRCTIQSERGRDLLYFAQSSNKSGDSIDQRVNYYALIEASDQKQRRLFVTLLGEITGTPAHIKEADMDRSRADRVEKRLH